MESIFSVNVCVVLVTVEHMKTMKPSDLTAKEFFQLTVNSLLELCTHSIDDHHIVNIEGRLLLSLDTGDKLELNILEQDVGSLQKSVKTDDTNTTSAVSYLILIRSQMVKVVCVITSVGDVESVIFSAFCMFGKLWQLIQEVELLRFHYFYFGSIQFGFCTKTAILVQFRF